MDTVKLGIELSTAGLKAGAKQAEKDLRELGTEAKGVGRDFDKLATEGNQAEETIKGVGNAAERADRQTAGLSSRLKSGAASLGLSSNAVRGMGRLISSGSDKLANQYTALAGSAGIGLALNKQMQLNDQLTQMGIAARDANGMIDGKVFSTWFKDTKTEIMNVSKATGQGAEDLAAGMQAVVQRTGNIKLASDNLKLMGETATASGSAVEDVGALIANLGSKAGIDGATQMRQAITLLLAQGKSGAFELKDMVTNGERLFSVMSLFGKGGQDGLKSFGAFVQMARTGTGSADNAATAIERLGATMANTKNIEKHLAGVGIHVKLDPKADAATNIKKVITASKGDLQRLTASQAFGEEGIRALSTFANEFAAGRGFQMFDAFRDAGGDITKNVMLQEDFKTRVMDSAFQMKRLIATMRDFGDKTLSGPLSKLTSAMEWINNHGELTENVLKGITGAIVALGAAVTLVKLNQLARDIGSVFRGGKTGGGLPGAGPLGSVTHVWVDNMGVGMGGAAANSAVAVEEAAAQGAAKSGVMARLFPTFSSWISSSGAWIKGGINSLNTWGKGMGYAAERMLGRTAAGRMAMNAGSRVAEYGSQAWQRFAWGGAGATANRFFGSVLGKAAPFAKGVIGGSLLALPIEYAMNGISLRSTAAGLGSTFGGTLGGMGAAALGIPTGGIASPALGFAGMVGGGIAGREASLAIYDLIARMIASKNEADASGSGAGFAPQFNIGVNFDAMGRPTTTVAGPGASMMRVNSQNLGPAWGLPMMISG